MGCLSFLASLALFVLLLVLALAVALCADGNDTNTASLNSYYFRAVIEVEQDEREFGQDEVLDTIQGWYQEPGRWRWDFGDEEQPDAGSFQVSDGETVVYYDRETNVFTRQSVADYNQGRPSELVEGPPLIVGGFFIGWLPYGDRERFFAAWQDGAVEESDGGLVAGRPTDAVTVTRGGDSTTLWVDAELPFVLKYESRTGGQAARVYVEVLDLELNEPMEASVFRFDAPADALEVAAPGRGTAVSSGSGTVSGSRVTVPDGFLTPGYLPEAYEVSGTGETHLALGVRSRFYVRWEGPAGYLDMVQQFRAGGLSETQQRGEPLTVDGREAFDRSTADATRLVFAAGDIVVTLESDALDLVELSRIAAGIR